MVGRLHPGPPRRLDDGAGDAGRQRHPSGAQRGGQPVGVEDRLGAHVEPAPQVADDGVGEGAREVVGVHQLQAHVVGSGSTGSRSGRSSDAGTSGPRK